MYLRKMLMYFKNNSYIFYCQTLNTKPNDHGPFMNIHVDPGLFNRAFSWFIYIIQYSSLQLPSHVLLCSAVDCSMPGFPVHHQLTVLTQTRVHRVGDAIQPSHSLLSPSPPAFNLSQHQGLFQRISSLHQVANILEFELQHQSFQ